MTTVSEARSPRGLVLPLKGSRGLWVIRFPRSPLSPCPYSRESRSGWPMSRGIAPLVRPAGPVSQEVQLLPLGWRDRWPRRGRPPRRLESQLQPLGCLQRPCRRRCPWPLCTVTQARPFGPEVMHRRQLRPRRTRGPGTGSMPRFPLGAQPIRCRPQVLLLVLAAMVHPLRR